MTTGYAQSIIQLYKPNLFGVFCLFFLLNYGSVDLDHTGNHSGSVPSGTGSFALEKYTGWLINLPVLPCLVHATILLDHLT